MYWPKRIDVKEGIRRTKAAAGAEIVPQRILTARTCHGQRLASDCETMSEAKIADVTELSIGPEAGSDG